MKNEPLLRSVERPALYFRPGRTGHTTLLDVLASGPPPFRGAVLEASLDGRHEELRVQLTEHGYEAVLDPMAMELATPGGWERSALRRLPWAGDELHTARALSRHGVESISDRVAEFGVQHRYNSIIAPTHYLTSLDDPWWDLDRAMLRRLRQQLDVGGHADIPLYYRLSAPRKLFLQRKRRREIVAALSDLPIDALWLCVHPVSAKCGAMVLKSYIEFCHDLATIGVPLVAERTGFLGLALLGFNVTGGIESGITAGEGFDVNRLLRLQQKQDGKGGGFALAPRVYFERLGVFLKRDRARSFLNSRNMKRRFGCQDRACCRNPDDMVSDPRRHLVYTRADEVARLSRVPPHNRPGAYVDFVRAASDDAVAAARCEPSFEETRRRLDGWRLTLAKMAERHEYAQSALIPRGSRVRRRKTA